MTKEKDINNLFDSAVLIGVLTLIGYIIGYSFSVGSILFYKLPLYLAEIDTFTLLASFMISSVLILICSTLKGVRKFEIRHSIAFNGIHLLIYLLFLLFGFYIRKIFGEHQTVLLIYTCLIALSMFLTFFNIASTKVAISEYRQGDISVEKLIYSLLILVISVSLVSFTLGHETAAYKVIYTANNETNSAVVAKYNNSFVLMDYYVKEDSLNNNSKKIDIMVIDSSTFRFVSIEGTTVMKLEEMYKIIQ